MQRQAEDAGIAHKTLRRAREKLGVKIRTDGFQGPSVWELPPQCCPSNPNDAHQNNMGNIGPDGQDWTEENTDPSSEPEADYPDLPSCLDRSLR